MKRNDFMPMDKAIFMRRALTGKVPVGAAQEAFTEADKRQRSRAERRREFKQIRDDVISQRLRTMGRRNGNQQ